MTNSKNVPVSPMAYVLSVPILIAIALWDGWIAWLGLNWFAVPFLNIEPVSFWMAFGVMLLVSWLTTDVPVNKPDNSMEWVRRVITRDVVAFVTMWIVHFLV